MVEISCDGLLEWGSVIPWTPLGSAVTRVSGCWSCCAALVSLSGVGILRVVGECQLVRGTTGGEYQGGTSIRT